MPFPVQIRRFSTALLKYFGLQGNLGLTLLEDVTPVIVVGTRDELPQAVLRGENRWGRLIAQPAVAAQFGQVRLVNPAGSTRLVVVHKVLSTSGTFTLLGVDFAPVAGSGHILVPLDTRLTTTIPARSVATLSSTTSAVSFFAAAVPFADLLSNSQLDPLLVLAPGTALLGEGGVVNTALEFAVWWTEIPTAPQELTVG